MRLMPWLCFACYAAMLWIMAGEEIRRSPLLALPMLAPIAVGISLWLGRRDRDA
jgi:hypothetical protein